MSAFQWKRALSGDNALIISTKPNKINYLFMFEFMFEFDIILLPFAIEFTLVVVDVLVAPVAELTVVLVVVVMVVLAALLFIIFVFLVAFVATFVLAASPQAIPNAPNAKRVESAITFLILN